MNKKSATAGAKKQNNYQDTGGSGNEDVKNKIKQAKEKLNGPKNNKNLEEAFKLLSEACNKEAENATAFKLRADCYSLMGDFQRALYDYSVAIRIAKENNSDKKELANYLMMAGVQHYELGQLDEALKHYDLAAKYDDKNCYIFFNRGLVKSRLDRVEEAVNDYEAALSPNITQEAEHTFQARFNMGICLRRLGPHRLNDSIDNLKKAAEMKNDRAAVHNNLGLSYFERGEPGDQELALEHYKKAQQQEKSAVHFNNKGLAHYHLDDLESALHEFNMAIDLGREDGHQEDPSIYMNRGNVYLSMKPPRYDKAHEDFDCALRIAPNVAKLHHAKGLAYQGQSEMLFREGNSETDMAEDDDRKQRDHDKKRARQERDHAISELNQKAIEQFQNALKIQDTFDSAKHHLGLMYHKTHQFQEALKCFSKVLLKLRDDKTVYIARGVVYQDMGNHQLAIKDFNEAISNDPALSEGYYRRGVSKLATKCFHDAIKDFLTSEQHQLGDDRNAGIPDGLGQCYHALKDFDAARQHYDEAIQMEPRNTDFLQHRAQCYYDLGEHDSSIADLQNGLKINREDSQLFYKLGLSYYADEKYKQCVRQLKAALMNGPFMTYSADVYYHIGLAYCNVEKFEKSIFPFT